MAFRASSSAQAIDVTLTLPVPTGTLDNDVMVAVVWGRVSSITPPAGWTAIGTNETIQTAAGSTEGLGQAYYRVASSEPASYAWTFGSSGLVQGIVSSYSGRNTSSPVTASGWTQTAAGNSIVAPSVTAASGDDVVAFAITGDFCLPDGTSSPSGMFSDIDLDSGPGSLASGGSGGGTGGGGGGGGGGSGLTFWTATDNTAYPRPTTLAGTPSAQRKPFTDLTTLNSLISGASSGDYIYYNGTGTLTITNTNATTFTLTGKSGFTIDFGAMASTGPTKWGATSPNTGHVKFVNGATSSGTGSGGTTLYLNGCSNLNIYGGEFTGNTNTFAAIEFRGATSGCNVLDFVAHDIGGNGVSMIPTSGATVTMTNNFLRGECGPNWCMNPAMDPHGDKGTGIHGAILFDSGVGGSFTNNKVFMYVHDSLQPGASSAGQTWPEGGGGSAIEIGQTTGGSGAGNKIAALGVNNLMNPNTTSRNPGDTQVQSSGGGNVINFWGGVQLTNCEVIWAEGDNIAGSVIHADSSTGWWTGANIVVDHGRHTNTLLHTTSTENYVSGKGITYNDCT